MIRRFPYKAFGDSAPRPVIGVELTAVDGSKFTSWALVDSGASGTLFPNAMMDRLGIDKRDCRAATIIQVDGSTTGQYWDPGHTIGVWDGTVAYAAEAFFAPLEMSFGGILLGRGDYLRLYDAIVFDERHQELRLELNEEPAR